ncbi:MAG TPA: hypothetical protein VGP83_16370, partial [Pyrinomonadaceae bacterium]|nr:hypothetical protein [Pyrinomonadaceae bacterium]
STLCDSILTLLNSNPGDCEVTLEAVVGDGTVVRVKPNDALRVKRSTEFEQSLKELGCSVSIERAQR